MMGQWLAEMAAEEREEGKAGRRKRQGRVMRILGEKGRGRCQEEEEEEEEGNEEAEGCKEEDEEEEEAGDCFFESLDRVQSSVSFAVDIPSSDDEDEEDDMRISFSSAIAPPCDFRLISFAAQEEVGCETDDDRGGGQDFDYDIWMAESMEMSLKERRLRLLQGMGLTSSKDLARSCSRIRSGRIPSSGLASSRLSSCVIASDDAALAVDVAAKAASASPVSFSLPVIARCRSDTELAASMVRGSASPGPAPALIRADSAPPSISDQRGLSRMWGMLGQEGGGTGTGGRDVVDSPSLTLASSMRIKNLDTGKEFVVSEIGKDGTWGRLNDLQTGLQLTLDEFEKFLGYSPIVKELMRRVNLGCEGSHKSSTSTSSQQAKSSKLSGRKKGGWFKNIKFVASSMTGLISEKDKGDAGSNAMGKSSSGSNSSDWLKVHQHGKSYKELTGLYMCQEIHAHQGAIWTLKFSSDWRYLASAGEDRIIHVWQVIECDALSSSLRRRESRSFSHPHQPRANGSLDPSLPLGLQPSRKTKKGKSSKKSIPEYVVMPETIFSLTEKPVCSFEGHLDDVLDLSWSKSQHLLSSSMDKTVRLWDIESKACLKLFAHNDYVTCIQFNPTDDSYFISGSLDAKVRIWSIPDRQVVDWSDLHEMVTAVCYTPDGQGALVGSHKGSCRYYKTSDYKLNQEAQIDIRSKKKKSHAKKITGFQFAPGNPSEVLITSADSQIRVFDGLDMIHKFRGITE
uniref:WD repeat-containing protein 44 isoform X2 n=1 Tax=Elaeis guineensis var. tenera TaxID=51953 RepID=A0A8N4ER57_ELAGV|nr:WD repeat-containing protein 44 isoform X2 [Elaeis guineensis]